MLKVAAVLLLFVVGAIFAVGAEAWSDVPADRHPAADPGRGAGLRPAARRAGLRRRRRRAEPGAVQLDPGQGLRHGQLRAPAGQPDHRPARGRAQHRLRLRADGGQHDRWRGWWKFANIEQLSTFVLITFLTILFTSLLAYSTVYGREGLENNIGFIQTEGEVLGERVGSWFQYFFWVIGAFSLFAAALGIVDYTSRLAADVLKTSYARNANESKMYAGLVWGLVGDRHRRAAGRLRPADRAAGHRRRGRRLHDVHLLRPADPDQPARSCRRRSGSAASGWPC